MKRKKKKGFSIKVSIRIKPILGRNKVRTFHNPIEELSRDDSCNAEREWEKSKISVDGKRFKFNGIVKPSEKQGETYRKIVVSLMEAFLAGYNTCLFAYGQTGSGKTHTLLGKPGGLTTEALKKEAVPSDWGLFPRAILSLLSQLDSNSGTKRTLHVSAVEVYFGNVFDLLNNKKRIYLGTARSRKEVGGVKNESALYRTAKERARMKREAEERKRSKFKMTGQTQWKMQSGSDVAKFSRLIEATRTAHSTNMNARSSRSHCLITVTMTSIVEASNKIMKNTFLFVDLAGSERIKKSGVEGGRKMEAVNTNSSLSALGRVVIALSRRKAYVPYRDTTLTLLMRNALGGNCSTHMICTIAQEIEHTEETFSTLQFGERSALIRNRTLVRESSDVRHEVEELELQITRAERELRALEKAGKRGGVDESEAVCTQNSFLRNKKILEEAHNSLITLRQQTRELEARKRKNSMEYSKVQQGIATAEKTIHIHTGIVARMMVSGLYKQPHDNYVKKKAEVLRLKSELRKLCSIKGWDSKYLKIEEYEKEKMLVIKQWKLEFC